MLQLCRGSAEIDCPVIGTCRNVGSNLGGHLRHDSYRQIGDGNLFEKNGTKSGFSMGGDYFCSSCDNLHDRSSHVFET